MHHIHFTLFWQRKKAMGKKVCRKGVLVLFLIDQMTMLCSVIPSYSALIRSVSSGPLWAEVTLRWQGMPYEPQALRIFSQ